MNKAEFDKKAKEWTDAYLIYDTQPEDISAEISDSIANEISREISQLSNTIYEAQARINALQNRLEYYRIAPTITGSIRDLDLPVRIVHRLLINDVHTIGRLLMALAQPEIMLAWRNFGEKSLDTVIAALRAKGYWGDTD